MKNKKLTIVAIIIIAGFTISVFYHYLMGSYIGLGFPFNTFLFTPGDKFNDFYNNYRQIILTGMGATLPAHNFINYIFFIPSLFSFHSQILAYVFYAGVFMVYLFFYNYINIKKHGHYDRMDLSLLRDSFIFTFLTYAVLFVIDRGNREMYVFIMLSLSLLFYYDKKYIVSAILLGLAIHLKIYFAIFLIIYFADKKYREIVVVISFFFILPFLALVIDKWLFPAVQFSGETYLYLTSPASSENFYNNLYVLGDGGAAYCSSLYGALKAILYFIFPDIQAGSLPIHLLFRLYFLVSLLCAGIVALYVIFLEKEAWRKVALATLSLILFPFVTGDYRLIMLFIPLWMFVNSKQNSKYNTFYAILFGLLLIPKDFYIIRNDISISVIINPLLIVTFMILLVWEGLSTWAEQNSEKFKKIKKQSLYAVGGTLILFSMLVISSIWFLLTPSGNDIVKTQFTTYLSNKFSTAVKFDTLRFSTEKIIVDLDIRSVAKVQLALLLKNNTLLGDYKLNVEDAGKFSKRFGEKLGFSTHGKITGTGINNINIDGNAELLQGAGDYRIELVNRKISRLKFDLKDVRTDDALKFIRKNGDGLIGTMDINGDVSLENRKPKKGYIILSGKNLTVKDPFTISEFTGLLLPKNANIDIKTKSDIKDDEMVSKIEVRAKEARLTMQDNRVNLNTRKINSDFIIKMNNVKDFTIGDNARFGFINQSLPGLKKFKSMLDKNYKGEVVVSGHFTKDGGKLALDGTVLDAPRMKNNDFIDKILPFRMQNGVLNCSTLQMIVSQP